MTTATLERSLTLTTLDGEVRTAETCPDGSWSCPFCSAANFPVGHDRRYHGRWDGPCANPACVVGGAMTEQGTRAYREREAYCKQRDEQERRWREAREQEQRDREAKAKAEAAKRERRVVQRDVTRAAGVQFGFAWDCFKHETEVTGTDRKDYAGHMKGHGLRAKTLPKMARLRKSAPVPKFSAVDCQVFKWLTWTETHRTPGTCECGHGSGEHNYWHGNEGGTWKCGECGCIPVDLPKPFEHTAERRGQFWAAGPHPHSVWVLPFEPLPWEVTTRPNAPVLVYPGKGGRAFTDSYSAKRDRG